VIKNHDKRIEFSAIYIKTRKRVHLDTNDLSTVSFTNKMTPSFVPSTCPNPANIGPNCNISNTACDLLKPCQNNSTCNSTNTIQYGYICLCPTSFTGTQCQFDHRPCKPNTCWNNGIYSLFFLLKNTKMFPHRYM
jgi:hypothetical protein